LILLFGGGGGYYAYGPYGVTLGYRMAGALGALAVGLAFFVPDCVIALLANRLWIHFRGSPWRLAVQRGMAPVAIGLMTSGTYAMARISIFGPVTSGIAIVVFLLLMWRHQNPAVLVLVAGLAHLLLRPP
jgi:chromate transporter